MNKPLKQRAPALTAIGLSALAFVSMSQRQLVEAHPQPDAVDTQLSAFGPLTAEPPILIEAKYRRPQQICWDIDPRVPQLTAHYVPRRTNP